MLATVYYAADLFLALSYPLVVWRGVRVGVLPRGSLQLFSLGVVLGLAWEVPIFALSAWTGTPIIEWLAPLPAPPVVFIVGHSLWDGMLLLGGWLIARRLMKSRQGGPWSPAGILIQLVWGQVTELAVELSAITAGTWVYLPDVPFNPVLFWFGGHPVTLGLQLVWFIAPLVFVLVGSKLSPG